MASVIKKSGMLATKQNIVIGWGVPAFIILFNMCFEYENYGGTYHCWLQMDKGDTLTPKYLGRPAYAYMQKRGYVGVNDFSFI